MNEDFNNGIDAVLDGVDFEGGIRAYADLIETASGNSCFVPALFIGTIGLINSD
ncbi:MULTISPECIES: hypothetical protein [Moorena]|uniref:hypothetical protein n=1 Tax=Moorena TaxID=1155738 RepID=UPI0013018DC0|nr:MULTISPECIES: hypothetical protein [Moorena]NEO19074.1 hypothetical protein [Moorena sp. SIO4A5]NEQ56416.1 hypothetical protein [Moorena sp. SIO4A1]